MALLFSFLLLIIFSFLLIKSTEILVQGLDHLSRATRVGKFALTSIMIGLSTSLPELFVCLAAALEGQQNLALGNILGSNIADLSLVIGGATLIGGGLPVVGDLFKKDFLAIFLAALLPLILLSDNTLSRVDGLLLLLVFGFYNWTILAESPKRKVGGKNYGLLRRLDYKGAQKQIAWVFLGTAMLLFSADMVVKTASNIAKGLNLPLFLVGLFLVAVGTSLPELSFEIRAVKKRQIAMALGDLFGSVVANSTFILGLTALLSPIKLRSFQNFFLATFFFVVIFLLFWFFIRTKRKLERWEGVVLILVYAFFIFLEFAKMR